MKPTWLLVLLSDHDRIFRACLVVADFVIGSFFFFRKAGRKVGVVADG